MKILFSTHGFWPDIGGIETASEALAGEFVRSGHEVRLITRTPGPDRPGSPYEIIRNPGPAALARLVRWCDLFFHNAVCLKYAWPLLFIRCPWVVAHQMWVSRLDRTLAWQDRLKRFLFRFCANIAISRAMAVDLKIPSVVIGNPYREDIFRQLEGVCRENDLVCLARLVSDKGVDVLVRALGILKKEGLTPKLTIVGSGPEEEPLRKLAADLGVSGQIDFAGAKTGAPLAELLNKHTIMVVPSRSEEPFGIVALEGIACGCVIAGSAGGGLPDAIGPCGVTFPNGDAGALAGKLKTLLSDGIMIRELRKNAAPHLARHTAKAVSEAYLSVFEGVTGKVKAAARKKHILIYTPQMAAYGGMERHICLLAQACARDGFDVTLVTTSNSLHPQIRQELIERGIRLHELPIARGKAPIFIKFPWLLWTALRLRSRRWDVIYTNGQSGLVPLMWTARRGNSRVIHHHHTSASMLEQKGWHFLYRKTVESVPELVACSEATKAAIEEGCGRSGVRFLAYITPILARAEDVADRKYSKDSPLAFGYFGRLSPSKGIQEICEMSAALAASGIRWHIYGEGAEYPPGYFERFPAVTYHGLCLDPVAYARALESMDAVVLFSRHSEGMPLSLIEAMAFGLPLVATDRGGTKELAVDGENSILIPAEASACDWKQSALDMAARIRGGRTSRVAQRSVYDARFAPEVVTARWLEFLRGE